MNSVPASPQISVNNFNQHYSNLIILIGGSNFLVEAREFFFAQPTPISETQELRESEVVRLEAHIPEKAFVGQQIQLGAIPLDKNNITVSGIKLSWEIEDTDGKIQTISNEQFIPEKFGEYSITVKGADKQQTQIIKIEEPSKTTEIISNLLPYQDWNNENIEMARDVRNRRGDNPGIPKINTNFNINAPILSIPGRAGLDLNLNLTYNSRLWTKLGENITYDIDKDSIAPGWSLDFGKIINLVQGGIVQVDPNGTKRFFTGNVKTTANQVIFEGQSTDGSFIKARTVTSGSIVNGQVLYEHSTSYLKYPDGTTILYTGYHKTFPTPSSEIPIPMMPTHFINKNNIRIYIIYHSPVNNEGKLINYISDSLGRIYTFQYSLINGKQYLTSIKGNGLKDSSNNVTERTFVNFNYKNQTLAYQFTNLTPLVRDNNNTVKVLSSIYYPATHTGYWFGDDDSYSSYGMIRKVQEQKAMAFDPLTEIISPGQNSRMRIYSYPENSTLPINDIPEYQNVTETWDGMANPNLPAITTYSVDINSNPRTTTITSPYQTGKTVEYSHNYTNASANDPNKVKDGISFKTEFYDGNDTLRSKDETDWGIGNLNFSSHSNTAPYNIKVIRPNVVTHTEYENGVTYTKKSIFDIYGAYNRVEQMREIDFNGNTIRKTKTQFLDIIDNFGATHDEWVYTPRLIGLPEIIEVFDGNDNRIDYTKYTYDVAPINGFPSTFPQRYVLRGNLSNVIKFSSVTNTSLENQISDGRVYDQYGNLIVYNPSNTGSNVTYFTYSSSTSYSEAELVQTGSFNASNTILKSSSTYDYNTSLPLTVTDANQQTATFEYDLHTWRLKKTTLPTGSYSTNEYDDLNRIYSKTQYLANGVIAAKSTGKLNGLGQPYRQETLSSQNGTINNLAIEVEYDNLGRQKRVSKPFRANDNLHGVFWSESFYDWAGRVEKTKSPDGSEKFSFYNESSRPQGASTELGKTFRSKDPIGREKWHLSDSDGNIKQVIEPNPNGDGSITSGGLVTNYFYDKSNNLDKIQQGSQERKFKYDSIGRLTHQKMSETKATLDENGIFLGEGAGVWSDYFVYDSISNIVSSTDARGVKTIFSHKDTVASSQLHDPLNRLFSISYETNSASNVLPSPTIHFEYQPNGNIAQLKSIYSKDSATSQRVATNEFGYDIYGRILEKKTTLASRPNYPMTLNYIYDSLSRVTDTFYPTQYGAGNTRKQIKENYDSVGRMSSLKVDNVDYASDFAYDSFDQLTSVKIGPAGSNQITEQYNYNSLNGLLENQKIKKGSSTLLDLSYQYQRCSCSTGGTGQITGIINNIDRNKDKNFEYDKLARLKKVSGGLNQSWTQIYNYDRYGNRTNVTSLGFEALRLNQQSISNNEEQDKLIKNSSPFITKDSLLNNVKGFLDEKTSNNQKQDSFKDLDKSDETDNTQSSNTTPNTQFDFDGDGKADFSTWRRKTGNLVAGTWSINNSQTGQTSNSQLGAGGNQIAPGDYDGDGKTDKATWNIDTGNWTIQNSSNGSVNTFQFGAKGDAIVPADYDGDHKTDLAIWRPSTGDWWIRRSSNNTTYSVNWGGQQFGDIPMVGDYDGDGLSDVSVWRPNGGNWYILVLPSSGGQVIYGQWGMIGDVPVPADYDGDHKTDFAVWRPSTGVWYVYQSSNGQYTATVIGSEANRDVLVPADYDGDGKTDLAVWTPSSGLWNVRKSTTLSNSTFALGTKDDVAVPSAYIRRSSSPKGQSVEIPNDGHGILSFEPVSNRISTLGFEYDFAGNQTRIVKEDGSKLRFQYDAAGRLIKVKTDSNQTIVTYTFGIGRERLITQEGDETSTNLTYYAWEGGSVISEYTEAAGSVLVWAKNYIFMNGALLATQEKTATGESVQFDHPDQLGTRLITNPATGTHFEQNTLPFGTALGSESTGSINRRFTSYDRSQSTGLDYAVNRFYDSSQGRFTTVDPIKMGAVNQLNPQTLNLYSYTANDPVNRTDPSGLDWGSSGGLQFGWYSGFGSSGGQAGNSFFTGLGQFLSGFLGNLFGGSSSSIRRIPYQLNTGTITPAAPPPLPGAGTTKAVESFGDRDFGSADCLNSVMSFLNDYAKSEMGELGSEAKSLISSLLNYTQNWGANVSTVSFGIANAYHETNLFRQFTEPISKLSGKYDGGDSYRGRGYIHLTGKGLYGEIQSHLNKNWERFRLDSIPLLVTNPDEAANTGNALNIMTAYFDMKGTFKALNTGSYEAARKTINPGESLNKKIGPSPKKGQKDTRPTIKQRINGLTKGLDSILNGC